jgi:hypothetical protein
MRSGWILVRVLTALRMGLVGPAPPMIPTDDRRAWARSMFDLILQADGLATSPSPPRLDTFDDAPSHEEQRN